jgi:hypothetical protein
MPADRITIADEQMKYYRMFAECERVLFNQRFQLLLQLRGSDLEKPRANEVGGGAHNRKSDDGTSACF